jgi:hypothetical protein
MGTLKMRREDLIRIYAVEENGATTFVLREEPEGEIYIRDDTIEKLANDLNEKMKSRLTRTGIAFEPPFNVLIDPIVSEERTGGKISSTQCRPLTQEEKRKFIATFQ